MLYTICYTRQYLHVFIDDRLTLYYYEITIFFISTSKQRGRGGLDPRIDTTRESGLYLSHANDTWFTV